MYRYYQERLYTVLYPTDVATGRASQVDVSTLHARYESALGRSGGLQSVCETVQSIGPSG